VLELVDHCWQANTFLGSENQSRRIRFGSVEVFPVVWIGIVVAFKWLACSHVLQGALPTNAPARVILRASTAPHLAAHPVAGHF
jgi:hypothetical protein